MLSLLVVIVVDVVVAVVVGSEQHASMMITQRALHFILLLLNRLLNDMKELYSVVEYFFLSSLIFIVRLAGHNHSFSFTYRCYYLFSATVLYSLCAHTLSLSLSRSRIQCTSQSVQTNTKCVCFETEKQKREREKVVHFSQNIMLQAFCNKVRSYLITSSSFACYNWCTHKKNIYI